MVKSTLILSTERFFLVNWSGKKVLVTGAGGFIGSHLSESLVNLGAEVTALVRYNSRNDWGNLELIPDLQRKHIEVVAGNIEDSGLINRIVEGKSIVFHLAALIGIPYSYVAPLSYIHTNIEGTLNVLEACRKNGVQKLIHTSTSETYGTAIYSPIDEEHPLQGQSPYSASKIGADKLAESFFRSFTLPVAIIRPFNTYGPRQSTRAVIPTIITQALTQGQIQLGSLDPVRDVNFVMDTVSGFIKVAESDRAVGEVINIGSGVGYSVGELAQKILSLMKIDKPIVVDDSRIRPTNSEVLKLVCDNSKAQELTGWSPGISLESGLLRTVEFIVRHLNLFKTEIYTI
jgi:NAD dependent epimerase/dehydratase